MIQFFLILVPSLVLALQYFLYKKYLLPPSVLAVVLCGTAFLSSLNLLPFLPVRTDIYHSVIFCVLAFSISFFLVARRENFKKHYSVPINFKIDPSKVKLVAIISLCLMLPDFIESLKLLVSTGFDFDAVRNSVLTEGGRHDNPLVGLLLRTVPQSMMWAVQACAAREFIRGRINYAGFALVGLLMTVFTDGGRTAVFALASFVLGAFVLRDPADKVSKRRLGTVIGIATLAMVLISEKRSGAGKIGDSFIAYTSGSYSFLEFILQHPDQYGLSTNMWGYVTFGFIFEIFILFTKAFFGSPIKVPSFYIDSRTQEFVDIGNGVELLYNNNCTALFSYWLDFGSIGPLVIGLIFGLILAIGWNKFNIKHDDRRRLILIFIFFPLCLSSMWYALQGTGFFWFVATVFFITPRVREIEGPNELCK